MDWFSILIPLVMFGALVVIGMPIGFALAIVGFTGYALIAGPGAAYGQLGSVYLTTMADFVFVPIPMFILMGEFMVISGLGAELYEAAWRVTGRLPGGLGVGSIVACGIVAAVSGISAAGIVTVGGIAIPEMIKRGYDRRLACGFIAAGGGLGILIPPSISFIVYGALAEQSIGALFVAGIVPGVLLIILFSLVTVLIGILRPDLFPRIHKVSWKDQLSAALRVWPSILLILCVLGSIYLGIGSISEVAAIGAFAAMCIALARRKLTLHKLWRVLWETAYVTGFIFIVLIGGSYFGYFLGISGITDGLIRFLSDSYISPWLVILCINLVLLAMGTLMDPASITVITTPILYPILVSLGFSPIWYGVILAVQLEMSFITPPVGLNVYVIKGLFPDIPLKEIFVGSLPFCITQAVLIVILMIFPQLTLWLPRLAGYS